MDHRDERLSTIDLTATAAAGMAVIVAILSASWSTWRAAATACPTPGWVPSAV